MTLEYVGIAPDGQVQVWILWCNLNDGPFLAWLTTLGVDFRCPCCGSPVDLYRRGGVCQKVAERPGAISVSDRCAVCQARLHFDATPVERRSRLRWPQVAIGAPLQAPPQLTR